MAAAHARARTTGCGCCSAARHGQRLTRRPSQPPRTRPLRAALPPRPPSWKRTGASCRLQCRLWRRASWLPGQVTCILGAAQCCIDCPADCCASCQTASASLQCSLCAFWCSLLLRCCALTSLLWAVCSSSLYWHTCLRRGRREVK